MSGEINLTQDKDGRADKHNWSLHPSCIHRGSDRVQSELHHCQMQGDLRHRKLARTAHLEPSTRLRRHWTGPRTSTVQGNIDTTARRLYGSSHLAFGPLVPSTPPALHGCSSRSSTLQQAQGCSVGSNCPPILNPVAVTGCPSHQQTNRPARIHRQTDDLVQALFPRPRIHASRPPVLHPVCHRGLTPSSPWRVGDNLQFRCEGSKPTPPGPHIKQRTTLLTITYPSPRFEFRAHHDSALRPTRFARASLAAHDRSARTTTIPTATQSTLLG